MFDYHSHILPGIDDGSRSPDMSAEMIRWSIRQGITAIALTPHFYADTDEPETFFQNRQASAQRLFDAAQGIPNCPRLLLGAEVHYYRGMGQSAILERFCIEGSNAILVELPFRTWGRQVLRDIEDIRRRLGLQVVIAHIDRYLSMAQESDLAALRSDAGALFQANAGFFLRLRTRRKAIRMLRDGQIDLLGSDCHNISERAPNLGPAAAYIESKLGPEPLAELDRRARRLLDAQTAAAQV